MNGRLVIAIVSTIAEEAATLILGVWLLPKIGVKIPLLIILVIMVAWLIWSVITYQKGTHALLRKPVQGLADMTGSTGVVVKALQPDGLVKIRGELWGSRSQAGNIEVGTRVVIVKQEGLRLLASPEPAVSDKQPTTR